MILCNQGITARVPDFLIVGAGKSGTTSLYHCLRQHPQIYLPQRKEPHYFSFKDDSHVSTEHETGGNVARRGVVSTYDDYVGLFRSAKAEELVGEASTSYLYKYEATIENIKATYAENFENLKIIAILRNPVDRAFSHYLFCVRNGWITSSFEDIFRPESIEQMSPNSISDDIIQGGMYYKAVKCYLEQFPQTKIYLFEDLNRISALLDDVFEFLGVDTNAEIRTDVKANPSGVPKSKFFVQLLLRVSSSVKTLVPQAYWLSMSKIRDSMMKMAMHKPEIDLAVRAQLVELYRSDVAKLQKLLGRDLSHWINAD